MYKKVIVIIAIALVGMLLVGFTGIYPVKREEMDDLSYETSTYSMQINNQGQITYIKTDPEDGTTTEITQEEIAEEISGILRKYIDGSDEEYQEVINYFMGAEAITKLPYVDPTEGESLEDNSLVGQIKFYRYTGDSQAGDAYSTDSEGKEILKEDYRLTYVSPDTFESKLEGYKNGGNEDVFKHFTMDEEGNVVIAYGTKEIRTITSKEEVDADLTEEIVRELSGEESYTGNWKDGFSMVRYSAYERKIDYISLVEQYIMPTNLLYALLIHTEDVEFVKEIAKLAYDSEIAIGIYDNQSQSNTSETYTYKKIMNMNTRATLNFARVETTDPVIKRNDLYNLPYYDIPHRCWANTQNGKIYHYSQYLKGNTSPIHTTGEDVYVTGVDSDGKITSLGTADQATIFTTTFSKTLNSTSTPTVGVILADTWMARWKSTYTKEDNEPSSSSNESTQDNVDMISYDDKDSVLNAFDSNMKDSINSKYDGHVAKLKESAINKIADCTDFTVPAQYNGSTEEDISELTKRNDILKPHIEICEECITKIDEWWATKNSFLERPLTNQVYTAITGEEGELKNTIVETHYYEALQNYIDAKNREEENKAKQEAAKKAKERKEKFKEELNEQITILTQTLTAQKEYSNIAFKTSYYRTSSTYKKDDTIETTDIGKRFSEAFNRAYSSKASQAFSITEGWIWEYIKMNEDTAKIEDMIKFLINFAQDPESYGDNPLEDEEIKNLFKTFEPKQEMKAASMHGMTLLRDYIRVFENAAVYNYIKGNSAYTDYVAKYISEDKTVYYIRDDGANHPTVGFGVDIFNGGFVNDFKELGYTEAQLRDMSGAVSVPVEFVDALEEREIKENYTQIREQTADLGLESYQIYALVSRAYNCGMSGAMDGYADLNFIDSYVEYYNPETDDRYGELEGDFEHKLYTEYMDTPIRSDGQELPGLVKRRKSEWTLFQTGYMDQIDAWAPRGDILEMCVQVTEDLIKNQVQYSLTNLAWRDIERSNDFTSGIGVCCATYVSVVLYRAELLTEDFLNSNQHNYNLAGDVHDGGVSTMMKNAGWILVPEEEAQPGDVCSYSEHAFIYAGGNEVWDQASGCISSHGDLPSGGTASTWRYYIDNWDVDVWRMPGYKKTSSQDNKNTK